MRVARRYLIGGRVQGVGFRYFVREAALRAGVAGWVRNLIDGRVEVLAEGEADVVEGFERQIRIGPAGAHVDQVELEEEVPAIPGTRFEVRSSSS